MSKTEQTFTPIEKIGRKGLIQKIAEKFDRHGEGMVYGIGDDAAVLGQLSGSHPLISTEIYSEGVDFDLTYTPWQHLGLKVVSMAVSDIIAMNGKPKFLFLNLSLTNKVSVEMVELFYSGVKHGCDLYGVQLAGGDLGAAHKASTVAVTVVGTADTPVYRSGAKAGDAICVTGDLGAASCGLMVLLREKRHFETSGQLVFEPDLTPFEYVVRKQLVPEARADCIDAMKIAGIVPTSMSDVSKSLVSTLVEMMESSKSGCRIYEAALPVHPETRQTADDLEKDIDTFVLYGGEDFELLFTLPEKDVKAFAEQFKDFVVIGKVEPQAHGIKMQTAEGHEMTLT
ncbi:thiamine-phosphate kinase [Cyclonatronum proteinivorum]|uniref:Thiamine-monophosphate kinase n=1 Tax=Cyclonatronum proteinivorum TaxID=1457365 RepID=A0A345UN57_9BACT|nr:thiamine-phosphate kinase [Cyclonatronum proteinivorum]AXJ01909.1 thiamine-phosphate kinase [Cyclonatronum proteinivorum]